MRIFIQILTLLPFVSAASQNAVTYRQNIPIHGDEIIKEQVEFIECGDSGKDILWDFSNAKVIKSGYKLSYSCDSIITATSPNSIFRYKCDKSGLKLIEVECPLITMNYNVPLVQTNYSLAYGDTASYIFDGIGKYCNLYKLRRTGIILHDADATGSISLTENDTLRDVIRIHTIKTCTVSMHTNCSDIDTIKNARQEIEELYTWYAHGCRYPVFETISRTTYNNMQPVSMYQAAFRCLPEGQGVSKNTLKAFNKSDISRNSPPHKRPNAMTSRTVTVRGTVINITYDMETKAHVTFIIANTLGLLYKKKELICDKGTGYNISIDCSNLHNGEYILYINVDGTVVSEKIAIKP